MTLLAFETSCDETSVAVVRDGRVLANVVSSAELDRPGEVFSLQEIVDLLRKRPDIVQINAGRQAEYWERFHAKYPPVELSR